MGTTLPFSCPVPGCGYSTYFRLGMGEELNADAHAERVETLRSEHPDHPVEVASSPPPIAVGDRFVLDDADVGDCPGKHRAPGGMIAFCVLDADHGGPHVATDGESVVEVWD